MAAIDKMYVSSYYDKLELVEFALCNKPSLLRNIYGWENGVDKWDAWKESVYKEAYDRYSVEVKKFPTIESIIEHYKNICVYDCSLEQATDEFNSIKEMWELLQDKKAFIEWKTFPISNFTFAQDRYLLWHCDLDFVRDYLVKQCGYKVRWYHKLWCKLFSK